MDRLLSAQVEERVVRRIGSLARRLRTSKKRVIESAIELYAAKVDKRQAQDVFEQTCGAWRRKESARELVKNARRAFCNSMQRRHV